MGTSIERVLDARELARMPIARHEMEQAGAEGCATKFTYFAAFDGTRNDRTRPQLAGDPEATNIGQLADQVEAAGKFSPYIRGGYFKGVGTGGNQGHVAEAAVFPSSAIEAAAQDAYADFRAVAIEYLKTPGATPADIGAAAVGFSRGCPAAIRFAQLVNEHGLRDPGGQVLIKPGQLPVTGLLLLDPVDRFVRLSMDIPPNVRGPVLSVIAAHETRSDFRAMVYEDDPRVREVAHPGNHAGVGGGYDPHGTAASVLEGATAFFRRRGIGIAEVAPEHRHRPELPQPVYTEAYQTARNGDVLTDEEGRRHLAWRVDGPDLGRQRTQPRLRDHHKSLLRQSYDDLAPGLKARGLSETQCLQVSAACTACAARHEGEWGAPRRFLLSRDGEQVAVQHENGRFEELRVDQALQRSVDAHLQALHAPGAPWLTPPGTAPAVPAWTADLETIPRTPPRP